MQPLMPTWTTAAETAACSQAKLASSQRKLLGLPPVAPGLSPLATYSGGRAPGSALTTPEQLRGVLDAFAQDVAAQAPSSAGQGLAFGQGLFAGSSDTLQPDQAGGAAYAAAQEQQGGQGKALDP
ncbi:hypothetical protein HaLaN_29282, partial [Haematococcus lacustris]